MERGVHVAIHAQVTPILAKEIFKDKCLKQCLTRVFLKQNGTKQNRDFPDCPSQQVHFLGYFFPVSSPHNFKQVTMYPCI